jgi:isopentenyl-diphosphate delta-isomerase
MEKNEVKILPPLSVAWHGGKGFLHLISSRTMVIEGSPPNDATGFSVYFGSMQVPILLTDADIAQKDDRSIVTFRETSKDLEGILTLVRKEQHIELCLTTDVEAEKRWTGFENLNFIPRTLPEFDLADVSLEREFLQRKFSLPYLITGMTGGMSRGTEINRRLAIAASELNIPMGVGSQRIALDDSKHAEQFNLKRHTPNLFLIANVGISQLSKGSAEDALRAVDMIKADALAIHINLIQEAVQPEGDRFIEGAYTRIAEVLKSLAVPLIIKEVGSGMDPVTASELCRLGVKALDVGGSGGTSWGWIEGFRGASKLSRQLGHDFRNWGIPTANAVAAIKCLNLPCEIIATGGMRGGIMAAKALGLGASMVGFGLPLFKAAIESENEVIRVLRHWSESTKRVLWATNSRHCSELEGKLTYGHPFEDQIMQYLELQQGNSRKSQNERS